MNFEFKRGVLAPCENPTPLSGIVPLELKVCRAEREFQGYLATWEEDDLGDTIDPHAFDATLDLRFTRAIKRKGSPDIRLLYQHDDTKVIGKFLEMRTDMKGLWVKGYISRTRLGNDVVVLLEDQAIDRMSIGYIAEKHKMLAHNKRLLQVITLLEGSLVTIPAQTEAYVGMVAAGTKKGIGGDDINIRATGVTVVTEGVPSVKNMEVDEEVKNAKLQELIASCESMISACKSMMEPDDDEATCESKGPINPRSEDAGGSGEPPSNHDADRDARAAEKSLPAPCTAVKAQIVHPHSGSDITSGAVAQQPQNEDPHALEMKSANSYLDQLLGQQKGVLSGTSNDWGQVADKFLTMATNLPGGTNNV